MITIVNSIICLFSIKFQRYEKRQDCKTISVGEIYVNMYSMLPYANVTI